MAIHRNVDAPLGAIKFESDPVCWMERCAVFTQPQQKRSREALQRIVVSGVRLFSANGFDGTRIADIVEDAGVPTGTFYQRFADKEALLDAIVAGYRACRMREIRALCTSPEALCASPQQIIELHIDIVFSVFASDTGLLRLIERRRLEDPRVHHDQSAANDVVATLVGDLLVRALPDRDPARLREQVVYAHSIIRGAVVWSTLPAGGEQGQGLKVTDTAFAKEALAMALRYLELD
jgi:AcrR family transcriptional regulator